jgi:hypothetical protein
VAKWAARLAAAWAVWVSRFSYSHDPWHRLAFTADDSVWPSHRLFWIACATSGTLAASAFSHSRGSSGRCGTFAAALARKR